jgi:hypothetical protein
MKNLTITVEDDVLTWAKVWAARQGSSLSRLVGMLLRRRMLEEEGYSAAMEAYLSTPPVSLKSEGGYPSRDELHDRVHLR